MVRVLRADSWGGLVFGAVVESGGAALAEAAAVVGTAEVPDMAVDTRLSGPLSTRVTPYNLLLKLFIIDI